MISILFAIAAGISLTLQNSFNGLMVPYVGVMAVSLSCFTMQSLLIMAYQLIKERNLNVVKKIPLPYYCSGFIGTLAVGLVGVCVLKMGSAVTQCCSIAGQMIMSAVVDHFGLFGTKKHRFSGKRIPGFALILAGVLAMNLIGGSGTGKLPIFYLVLDLCLGMAAIISRTMNHKVSEIADSAIAGGLANSFGGVFSAIIAFTVMSGFQPNFAIYANVPTYIYLAGVFATSSCLCNINAYRSGNIFFSTIMMLIGQVATGIIMDVLVFHTLSVGRCIGITIILGGILLDKVLHEKD